MKQEKDDVSGEYTTGHEWDGVKELNTAIPKAIRYWLYSSIVVAVVLLILYPSFPSFSGYAKGLMGYSAREAVTQEVEKFEAMRQTGMPEFGSMEVAELAEDPTLEGKYAGSIAVLYRDNCAACHGRDLMGQTNFPNLTDEHWLWSGTPEEIEFTIREGINHTSDDTRLSQMPAFGGGVLSSAEINAAVEYVLSLSGADHDGDLVTEGAVVFEDNCASCHNDAGLGGYENGAPSLADQQWIYGGSRQDIRETIYAGRQGIMPGWSERLSDAEIKQLTLYVLWSGAKDDATE